MLIQNTDLHFCWQFLLLYIHSPSEDPPVVLGNRSAYASPNITQGAGPRSHEASAREEGGGPLHMLRGRARGAPLPHPTLIFTSGSTLSREAIAGRGHQPVSSARSLAFALSLAPDRPTQPPASPPPEVTT